MVVSIDFFFTNSFKLISLSILFIPLFDFRNIRRYGSVCEARRTVSRNEDTKNECLLFKRKNFDEKLSKTK